MTFDQVHPPALRQVLFLFLQEVSWVAEDPRILWLPSLFAVLLASGPFPVLSAAVFLQLAWLRGCLPGESGVF